MEVKEAMSAIEGLDFEGKDDVLNAIRGGFSARNEEAKNSRLEVKV